MSLVGPRPFVETGFDAYQSHHFSRLGAKPGITVCGRSAAAVTRWTSRR